jgi:hypothetical protein
VGCFRRVGGEAVASCILRVYKGRLTLFFNKFALIKKIIMMV